jgi:hypothetical protein
MRVKDPFAKNFQKRFIEYTSEQISYITEADKYEIHDSDLPGPYAIDSPDFNFSEFRSNLVARWEYKAGSVFYLVWSHKRSANEADYTSSIWTTANNLWDSYPTNVVMLKFNYWFTI